jgi:hypothetical protein
VDPDRQLLQTGLIGVLIGGLLGAIIGVMVGTTADSKATQTQIETVIRTTQNVATTKLLPPPSTTTNTTTTSTVPVDTVPPIVAPPANQPTTPTYLTLPSTSTAPTTSTTPNGGINENDIQPADPATPPANFCDSHVCGPSYAKGDGPAVQCADGVWTRQGGEAVTCSADGGLGRSGGGA